MKCCITVEIHVDSEHGDGQAVSGLSQALFESAEEIHSDALVRHFLFDARNALGEALLRLRDDEKKAKAEWRAKP